MATNKFGAFEVPKVPRKIFCFYICLMQFAVVGAFEVPKVPRKIFCFYICLMQFAVIVVFNTNE